MADLQKLDPQIQAAAIVAATNIVLAMKPNPQDHQRGMLTGMVAETALMILSEWKNKSAADVP